MTQRASSFRLRLAGLTSVELQARRTLRLYSAISVCSVVKSTSLFALARQHTFGLCDDAQHDLVSAAADREQPRVAVGARDARLFHVAHAALELQALIPDLARQSPPLKLPHRAHPPPAFPPHHLPP